MKYAISETCPKVIIFQSLDSGDYDYSEFGSEESAWEAEISINRHWIDTAMMEGGKSLDECRAEFIETLTTATPEEALSSAESGYGWPLSLGFVEEVEEEKGE